MRPHRGGPHRARASGLDEAAGSLDPFAVAGHSSSLYAESGNTQVVGNIASWVAVGDAVDYATNAAYNDPSYESAGMNSKPCMLFDRANTEALRAATHAPHAGTSHTVVAAVDLLSTAGIITLLDFATGRVILGWNGGFVAYFDGTWRTTNPTGAVSTGLQVVSWRLDGGTPEGRVYVNGSQVGGALTYSPTALGGQAAIGSYQNASNNHLNARVRVVQIVEGVDESVHDDLVAHWMSDLGL